MNNLRAIFSATLQGFIRDRLVQILLAFALLIFLVVPALSLFSMRQVQELSVTLSLSAISAILLLLTVILGSSSVWRDLDRRYLASILGLPISRTSYILGKFGAIVVFILAGSVVLGLVASAGIALLSAQYPSETPVRWVQIWVAVLSDGVKCVLVAAVAILFSSLSTSFYLPFVATLAIYFCGSASQTVFEYVTGAYGKNLSALSRSIVTSVYYLLPNFSAFDFKIQAVYAVPIGIRDIGYTVGYFFIYTAIILMLAVWAFNRRELA